MKAATCFVGAGYSFVAGLSLAKDLLSSNVAGFSKRARRSFSEVWSDFEQWQSENPAGYTEQYLLELYTQKRWWGKPHFAQAVELIGAVLATAQYNDSLITRYGVRITQPSKCEYHTDFWSMIASLFDDFAVITTNYDILIERALRHRPMKRVFGPGCYYGGIIRPQVLKGTALPFSTQKPQRKIRLHGRIPVYKLHGSLNWSRTRNELALFQDMRPAFRKEGDAAIVPPVPEKDTPAWLKPVWRKAMQTLTESQFWIICGYSLPDYDVAIRTMLQEAVDPALEAIIILDPHSDSLKSQYSEIAPHTKILCLSGLPKGIQELPKTFKTTS